MGQPEAPDPIREIILSMAQASSLAQVREMLDRFPMLSDRRVLDTIESALVSQDGPPAIRARLRRSLAWLRQIVTDRQSGPRRGW